MLTHLTAHAHGAASAVHSLPFGIGLALAGGFLLAALFSAGRSSS